MAYLSDYFNLAASTANISGNITAGNVEAGNTLTVGGAVLTAAGNTVAVNGNPLIPATGDTNISTTGDITAGNLSIGAGGSLTFPDGSVQLTAANYSNANVAAYLPTNTANVSADYFLGNGALLTGITANYSNSNVASYLANGNDPTIAAIDSTASNTAANVTTLQGNVTTLNSEVANNASNITVLQGNVVTLTSGLANTDANVATLTSELSNTAANVTTLQGNVVTLTSGLANTDANVVTLTSTVGNNSSNITVLQSNVATLQSNVASIEGSIANLQANTYTDANVAAYLPTYTGVLSGNRVTLGTGNLALYDNVIESTSQDITLDPVADGSPLTGNVIILGNLSVTGNTITTNPVINTTDALLWQAANNAATPGAASGGGLAVGPVGNSYASFTFDSTRTAWRSSLPLDVVGEVSATANITAPYFLGNGSQLTGMYGNADVSNYLANGANPTITALQTEAANTAANVTTLQGNVVTLTSGLANTDVNVATLTSELSNTAANVTILQGNIVTLESGLANTDVNVATLTSEVANNAANITILQGNIANLGNVSLLNLNGNASEVLAGDGTWVAQTGGSGTYGNANVAAYLPTYNGNLGNVGIANTLGVLMGTPTQGNLISNAVSLTTTTALTDSIALLNNVLGKLVPPAPPAFPASQTLTISGLSTYRMANITQVNNTGNSLTVAAGATVTNARRAAAYTTNTISTAGPGDSGLVTAYLNGTDSGNVTLTGSSNGTYGNLIISANQDYHVANASITAGFWSVFSASLSGTGQPGWNDVAITDSAAGNTNAPSWYYDNSSPATPAFSSTSFALSSNTVTYTSTVPHYTSATQFNIGFTVANVSGNMYPTSNTFVTGTAGGAFQAPVSVNYNQSSLGSNVIPSFATANVTTTSNVAAGFGSSATGPSVSVNNSYNTGTQAFAPGATVLYKTGSAGSLTFLDEGNIFVGGTIGSGVVGAVSRIVNPGAGDTPVYTGTETAFNSTSGPLQTYDAAVVANVLSCNKTNYSTGYLPVGPDLSGQDSAQYFTFKFVAPSTSKFDVYITGTIAGLYIALPGSGIDTSSTLNGWMDASISYAGAGQPGAGTGGNGSNGCALGTVVPINTAMTARRTTCTFGTTGTAASTGNEVYVRIKLTTGQTVTSLAIYPASN